MSHHHWHGGERRHRRPTEASTQHLCHEPSLGGVACLPNFCRGRLVRFPVRQSSCPFSRAGARVGGQIRGGRSRFGHWWRIQGWPFVHGRQKPEDLPLRPFRPSWRPCGWWLWAVTLNSPPVSVRLADTPGPGCQSTCYGVRWPVCTASELQGRLGLRQGRRDVDVRITQPHFAGNVAVPKNASSLRVSSSGCSVGIQ